MGEKMNATGELVLYIWQTLARARFAGPSHGVEADPFLPPRIGVLADPWVSKFLVLVGGKVAEKLRQVMQGKARLCCFLSEVALNMSSGLSLEAKSRLCTRLLSIFCSLHTCRFCFQ